MKKITLLILTLALVAVVAVGCAPAEQPAEPPVEQPTVEQQTDTDSAATEFEGADLSIASLKGPTSMGLVKLFSDSDAGTLTNRYSYEIFGAADEVSAKIIAQELDIASVPANLAAVLFNKTGEYSVININTLGVLYIVETGEEISSIEDLKGKTLLSTGKGTTPEFALNYILTQNGIDPASDVTIEYKSEATEIAALLSEEGNQAIAVLPQPYVTAVAAQNPNIKISLNLTEEWDKVSNGESTLVTGVTIAKKSLIEQNPAAVEVFLKEAMMSAEYTETNVEEAAALIEQYEITSAAIAKTALPLSNIVSITGDEMKTLLSGYLQTLFDQNPASVGGSLPSDEFYYTK